MKAREYTYKKGNDGEDILTDVYWSGIPSKCSSPIGRYTPPYLMGYSLLTLVIQQLSTMPAVLSNGLKRSFRNPKSLL